MKIKSLILVSMIIAAMNMAPAVPVHSYDIVFLVGFDDSEWEYGFDYLNEDLQELAKNLDLNYFYYRGSSLPRVKTKMLILYAHGDPKFTLLGSKDYSNGEFFDWFDEINLEYLVSESCYSGRFIDLKESIDVLASSNDSLSSLTISGMYQILENTTEIIDFQFDWGLISFFLKNFSFNLTESFHGTIDGLKNTSFTKNQTIWSRVDSEIMKAYMG